MLFVSHIYGRSIPKRGLVSYRSSTRSSSGSVGDARSPTATPRQLPARKQVPLGPRIPSASGGFVITRGRQAAASGRGVIIACLESLRSG